MALLEWFTELKNVISQRRNNNDLKSTLPFGKSLCTMFIIRQQITTNIVNYYLVEEYTTACNLLFLHFG